MATNISSTFDIITELAAGTGTTNIANPGRAFTIVGLYGTGVDNATLTVSKVSADGLTVTACGTVTCVAATGGLTDQPGVLTAYADRQVLATDTLRLVRAGANSTRIVIRCEAYAAAPLTES